MDIWNVSHFGYFKYAAMTINIEAFVWIYIFILLGKYVGVKFLSHVVNLYLAF